MSDNENRDPASSKEQARRTESEAGPVGRTRKEEQRRRLIVTGLATPALMSLPSRRVWASKCTKSKLLSGNLSAKKKTTDCEPMGCGLSFWQNDKNRSIRGIDWWTDIDFENFDALLYPGALERQQIYNGDASIYDVLASDEPPHSTTAENDNDLGPFYGGGGERDAVRDCAHEAAACFLNFYFIKWPPPNDLFDFELSLAQIQEHWQTAVGHALEMSRAANAEKDAKAAQDAADDDKKAAEDRKKAAKDANDTAAEAAAEADIQAAILDKQNAEDDEQQAKDDKHAAKEELKAVTAILKTANDKQCPL